MVDIVGFAEHGVMVALSTGNGFTSDTKWVQAYGYGSDAGGWSISFHPRYLADVNGDGKSDIIGFADNGVFVSISKGNGFTQPVMWNASYGADDWNIDMHPRQMSDINGDGMADILAFADDGVHISLSTGNSFTSDKKWLQSFGYDDIAGSWRTDKNIRITADVDGDGAVEIVGFSHYGVEVAKTTCRSILRLTTILDGFNLKKSIQYKPLTYGEDFYSKGSISSYPIKDFQGALYAVYSITVPDGIGSYSTTVYNYSKARIHLRGKGFLGFEEIVNSNATVGLTNISVYEYNPTYFNVALRQLRTQTTDGTPVSSIFFTNSIKYSSRKIFPYVSKKQERDNLKNITTVTTYDLDNYGNEISTIVQYGNDATSTITNEFIIVGGWGIPNKLKKSTITATYAGQAPFARINEYDYDNHGNRILEIIDPNKSKEVRNIYEIDNVFGMVSKHTVSSSGLQSRFTSYQYDSKYRFNTITTNALGNRVSKTFDSGTGNILTTTGVDNKTSTSKYDALGRLIQTTDPLGITSTVSYLWSVGTSPSNTLYQVLTNTPGKPSVRIFYDALGRELRRQVDGLNGLINTDQTYYANGKLYKTSKPYFDGSSDIKWVTNSYYGDGRIKAISDDGYVTTYIYNGNSVTTRDPSNRESSKVYNALGDVITSSDNLDGTVTYVYNSSGQVKQISAVESNITLNYDEYGRQTSLTDPNSGTTTYDYNAYNELISQTDAKGINTSISYDILGRILSKTTPEGNIIYSYLSSGNGIGQLSGITGPGSDNQTFTYDAYGRLITIREGISGTNYTTAYSYDNYNNITQITYPSGFVIKKLYNSFGDLTEIKRGDSNATIWKNENENALGLPVKYYLGNGQRTVFSYDKNDLLTNIKTGTLVEYGCLIDPLTGNLTYREDKIKNLHEDFTYDNLDRLVSAQVTGSSAITVNYANNGNILSKSDAGSYTYDAKRKNAISTLTSNIQLQKDSISYNSFNKATKVFEGNYRLEISYGPDNERIKSLLYENNTLVKTKIFASNYEKVTKSGLTQEIHYIADSYGLIAVYIKQGGSGNLYYVCKDHLGSIIALIDQNGNVERYSYDPWGRKRNPDDWSYNNVPTTSLLERGYTGHEHLPEFGLINMNGRMYDPLLGRMLSPDNYVQNEFYTQGYNRYSYCLNNPLKYTDPTGNFIPFFVTPSIGYSKSGGLDISITGGIGFQNKLSVQSTVGYSFGNNNFYAQNGISYCGATAYYGWGSQSGHYAGVSYGLSSGGNLSSNVTSIGINYSQNGGWSGNISAWRTDEDGKFKFDPSISYSHTFTNSKRMRVEAQSRSDLSIILASYAEGEGGVGDYYTHWNIARTALEYVGSSDWALGKSKGDFGPGDFKCNLFVYDVLTKVGVSPGLPNQAGFFGKLLGHGPYPPSAGQWANPNYYIPGWRVLGPNEFPMSGDVAAIGHNSINASGHVGIVFYNGRTISQSAKTNHVSISSWGFRPGDATVFRRYVGN